MHSSGSRLLPVMRYRDLAGAIDWLTKAFGFETHQIMKDPDGAIQYAVLTYAKASIMLGPVPDSQADGLMKQPDEIDGAETQSCYLIVDDVEAHRARAQAAGAEIILDLKEYEAGGQGYSCRDPEGHIWSFGTYSPWQSGGEVRSGAHHQRRLVLGAMLLIAIVAGGWIATAGHLDRLYEAGNGVAEALTSGQTRVAAALDEERNARQRAERTVRDIREKLVNAQAEAKSAEQRARRWALLLAEARRKRQRAALTTQKSMERAARELTAERKARQKAVQSANAAADQHEKERSAKDAAERGLQTSRKELAEEERMRKAAQRAAQEAIESLSKERSDRESAERTAQEMRKQLKRERSAKDAALKDAQSLRQQLLAVQRAKEEAERAAEVAQDRIARLRAARESLLSAPQEMPPPPEPRRSSRKQAPQQKPARDTTPTSAAPMPALIP